MHVTSIGIVIVTDDHSFTLLLDSGGAGLRLLGCRFFRHATPRHATRETPLAADCWPLLTESGGFKAAQVVGGGTTTRRRTADGGTRRGASETKGRLL